MSAPEKIQFQAEIQQILDIVIHSLYTDKEIFVRELVSNAADASEKLRFLRASGETVFQPDVEPIISVTTDSTAKTVTITDRGVGMTREELIRNLGTIAHSGSKAFLKQIAGNEKGGANLIGQFGVGFYSAFMVADKVTVRTRSYREDGGGLIWTSDGTSGYEIEEAEGLDRGTRILLHLKEDQSEFATASRVEDIIRNYSSFVPFPIELNGNRVNTVQAIWARSKSEVTDAEYEEFYKFNSGDYTAPRYRLHFTADAPLSIQALLFVPERNPEKLGMSRTEPGVNLHCRKVLIQSKVKELLPEWLRFVKGVVDSEDLPLNISRETMQDSALVRKLNSVLAKRFVKFLAEQAEKDPENYDKFYEEFGRFIKEGVAADYAHRDDLAKLLRFESSAQEKGKNTSLTAYVERMPEEQKEIYFILGPTREAAESSPYFEVLRARKFEALFLTDPWDEFVMEHLREFSGKKIRPAEKAEIELDDLEKKEGVIELSEEAARLLANYLKETLADRVREVRVSKRLVDSPAAVVDSDDMMTSSMRRVMKDVGRTTGSGPSAFPQDLEINPRHPLLVKLEGLRSREPELAGKIAEQLLDSALVAAGLLDDPRLMLRRLNDLMLAAASSGSSSAA